MPYDRIRLGRRISLSFDGAAVKDSRAGNLLKLAEGVHYTLYVVAVDGAEIAEAQRLEQIPTCLLYERKFDSVYPTLYRGPQAAVAHTVPHLVLEPVVSAAGSDLKQVVVKAARIAVDGLVVIVQDHQQVGTADPGIVQAFKSEASRKGAVANERDHLMPEALELGGLSQTKCRRNGSGRMAGAEAVVLALRAAGETAESVFGAVLAELLPAAGKNLVGVGLMPDVEYDFVFGAVEHIMEADYQFHCAQAGCQMAGIDRTAFDYVGTQFRAQLLQLSEVEATEICRRIYFVQQFVHPDCKSSKNFSSIPKKPIYLGLQKYSILCHR